jgi:hypothetical protein
MAEFHFVSTLTEAKSFSVYLLNTGCFDVPVVFYPTPVYTVITAMDEIPFEGARGWHAFLFSKPEWDDHRLQVQIHGDFTGLRLVIADQRNTSEVPMSVRSPRALGFAFAVGLAVAAPANGITAESDVWRVEGKLLGENGEKSKDVSGIACAEHQGFPRLCLVVDDELQDAQFVEVQDGHLVVLEEDPVHLIDDKLNGKPLSLDGEGVAYADGYFYVIGSHGYPRDPRHKLKPGRDAEEIQAKIAASSKLIRIKADPKNPAVEVSTNLKNYMPIDPLGPFVDRRLDENGVTIEGLAVRAGRVFVGFRGPYLGSAEILSADLGSLFGNTPANVGLNEPDLGQGRGVRDLAPFRHGLLILAGPSADCSAGSYSVFWCEEDCEAPQLLADLPALTDEDREPVKPEAILPLDGNERTIRILILSDGAKKGGPRMFEIPAP